ncbi:MAG: RsmE family RNA methyltransferase [Bryobacteraceae bacterium]
MARRRFFVDEVRNQHAELLGEEANHLSRVLRVEEGQKYELSDNQDVYFAEVEMARKERVVFRVLEKLDAPEPVVQVTLFLALIKFDRLEWILEKATELGVSSIALVRAVRSEKGLDRAAEKRMVRWRRILLESSQQARRARLPELFPPVKLDDALRSGAGYRLFLDEGGTGTSILTALGRPGKPGSASLLIGPEGGWTDVEREATRAAQWTEVSLGPQILRTETAAISALAVINAVWQGITREGCATMLESTPQERGRSSAG